MKLKIKKTNYYLLPDILIADNFVLKAMNFNYWGKKACTHLREIEIEL